MPTTVHLPPDLLKQIDQRAGELRMSRNRYIRQALETAIREETRWSASFLETLAAATRDMDSHQALDEMMRAISSRRSRKGPPKL
ncbi:MAG: ribbon-helix-helix domain-containing protein [Acidobacteriota bacterium]